LNPNISGDLGLPNRYSAETQNQKHAVWELKILDSNQKDLQHIRVNKIKDHLDRELILLYLICMIQESYKALICNGFLSVLLG